MSRRVPPLWTWPAATALCLVVIGALAIDPKSRTSPEVELNLARLDEPAAADRPLIVIMGRSRTRCAVAFDDLMEAELRQRGLEARFVRLTANGGHFSDFAPAFSHLQETRPELLLVEQGLFAFNDAISDDRYAGGPIARAQRAVRARAGLNRVRFNYRDQGGVTDCDGRLEPSSPAFREHYLAGLDTWVPLSEDERQAYAGALGALAGGGTQIVLFDLPRHADARSMTPAVYVAQSEAAAEKIAAAAGAERLGSAPEPETGAYADFAYLNGEGRRQYSAWLADKITGLLAQ